jgi:hypothetical protein
MGLSISSNVERGLRGVENSLSLNEAKVNLHEVGSCDRKNVFLNINMPSQVLKVDE